MLGQEVVAAAMVPRGGYEPINAIGRLAAAADMTTPFTEGRYDFTVGSCAALSIDRDRYLGSTRTADGLHIELGRDGQTTMLIRVASLEPRRAGGPQS